MAKRHEDRKPGQRFARSDRPARPAGPSRGGSSRGGSSRSGRKDDERGARSGSGPGGRSGPSDRPGAGVRPGTRGPKKKGPVRKSGIRVTPSSAPSALDDGKVRLNRFLAMSGVCSRRAADELIASGSVEVNGQTITELGFRVDPGNDKVAVDGEGIRQEKKVYVLFNKPTNVVCTNARNEQKKRVIDFLPEVKGRLFTVGRLDLDSEGLILLTNDGEFAQRLTHPRYGVPKTYSVVVRGRIGQKELEKARGGVWLAEGPTQGMQIKIERAGHDKSTLKVVLREGKNREIRRVFARLDLPVLELKRIRIGELSIHGMKPAEWRFLLKHEVDDLLAVSSEEAKPARPDRFDGTAWKTDRDDDGGEQ